MTEQSGRKFATVWGHALWPQWKKHPADRRKLINRCRHCNAWMYIIRQPVAMHKERPCGGSAVAIRCSKEGSNGRKASAPVVRSRRTSRHNVKAVVQSNPLPVTVTPANSDSTHAPGAPAGISQGILGAMDFGARKAQQREAEWAAALAHQDRNLMRGCL